MLQVVDDRCHGQLNAGYGSKACFWAHPSSPNADNRRSQPMLGSPLTRASVAPHPSSRSLSPGGHVALFCDDFPTLQTGPGNLLIGKIKFKGWRDGSVLERWAKYLKRKYEDWSSDPQREHKCWWQWQRQRQHTYCPGSQEEETG